MAIGYCSFLLDNIFDDATVSSGDTETGYSLDDLKNDLRAKIWQSTNTGTSKVIDIQLPAGAEYDTIALIDHNLKPLTTDKVTIQACDTGFNTGTCVSDTLQQYHTAPNLGTELFDRSVLTGYTYKSIMQFVNPVWVHRYDTVQTNQYIRLTFVNSGVMTQLGRVFIGKRWEPSVPMTAKPVIDFKATTQLSNTVYGVGFGQDSLSIKRADFGFSALPMVDRRALSQALTKFGRHRPCVVQLRPGRGEDDMHLAMYGQFSALDFNLFVTDDDDVAKCRFEEWV